MAKETRPAGDHPVSRAVACLESELADLADVPLLSMDPEETGAALVALGRLSAQVAELELRVAAHAEDTGAAAVTGASSTASWWAQLTRQDRPAASGRVRLADALGRYHAVRGGLAAGDLSVEQARVITRALDALPGDLDHALVVKAEALLVAEAPVHDPEALRLLGKRLLTVLDPEAGEAADARALEAEEREARARAWLTMCPDGRGSMVGRFSVPEVQGEMLRKALMAFAAPKHVTGTEGAGSFERRPPPERLGDALVELIERLSATDLPDLGGMGATVMVHIPLASLLRDGDESGWLDTGSVVSASQARRWACEAGIIPVVLGAEGEVLDQGRQRRFFTKAQRQALNVMQPTCTTVGCDWPAYLCHAHHDRRPWSGGGTTDLADGRNLCPHHHARIHDPAYATTRHPDGQVSFHRREEGCGAGRRGHHVRVTAAGRHR